MPLHITLYPTGPTMTCGQPESHDLMILIILSYYSLCEGNFTKISGDTYQSIMHIARRSRNEDVALHAHIIVNCC